MSVLCRIEKLLDALGVICAIVPHATLNFRAPSWNTVPNTTTAPARGAEIAKCFKDLESSWLGNLGP